MHAVAPGTPRLIRSAVFNGYLDVARSAGLDPYRMIARWDLPPACLTDPEVKVSAAAAARLLEDSARQSGKIDFGLRLAERRSLSNVGALALLVREQPNVRRAVEVLVGYMHLHSEALVLNLEERKGTAYIKLVIDLGRPITLRQSIELGMGFLHRSLQQLLGNNWKPISVQFTHNKPERTDAYRRFFGTTVKFGQTINAIVCSSRDLDLAVPSSDAAMARYVQDYLDTFASRRRATMSTAIRDCIYVMLPSGLCSAEQVARRFGIDRRTIHRQLLKEGTSFSSLLDSVRTELVTRYVENRGRSLSSVAELLGFSGLVRFHAGIEKNLDVMRPTGDEWR